ncbi:thioredoxin domain-containing protein [Mucilaginibacter sp. 21P]|uniref:vitamin K epoxide reductase family protein n=1 Tax=Mucilaginibacter sp. 21P TaxID=2778902 RepID=UPI001C597587|nr:vitamin K epoxide reductase family protein [Mucilaginibacter sp. 21P]QXV65617.1 thioredoxin domain-containing protein [Mucilaginibacter sp. 21P]
MKFNSRYNNPEFVSYELLTALGAKVSAEEVNEELEIHPDYPNLLAINDVLNNFGAEAGAYRIQPDDLPDVPCPFIAHTTKPGHEFMLVKRVTGGMLTVISDNSGSHKMNLKEFNDIFDGVVLVPEHNGETHKPQSKSAFHFNQVSGNIIAALICVLIAGGIFLLVNNINIWQSGALLIVKTAGLAVSILLLVQSIDKNNPLVQTLCGGGGKTNCNAILSSKAANVVKGLSWSDVGFFYFAGTWLAVLFSGNNLANLQVLAVLNILSLPYTFYSIYYQARVAKQWCLFCCVTQALLWLEFGSFITLFNQPFNIPAASGFVIIALCLALPVTGWLLLKPLLLQNQQGTIIKEQLRKFKYNQEVFSNLLKEQPKYALPHTDWSIVLGNVEADNIITMVSNPYCPPCANTHSVLDKWLDTNLGIQVRLVFTASNYDGDIKTPVTRHFMALADQKDEAAVKLALHDWYEQKQKSYEAWANKHPVTLNENQFYKLEKQRAWCDMADIKATPTILVNGHRLPDAYRIQDIKYLLAQQ